MRRQTWAKMLLALFLLAAVASAAWADVTLPAMFSDHMVLQREIGLPVWGWAEPGEQVAVTLGDQTETAVADDAGKWSVTLAAQQAGGPHKLTVKGKNTVQIDDVLVGEVWLASGQSNMAMSVARSANFPEEQAAANYPQLRMFTVTRVPAETPQQRCEGAWQVSSPESVGSFSATAYFFGRELHQQLDVPVGLINSSWGGTPIEAWTSLEVQQALPDLESMLEDWKRRIDTYDPEAAQKQYEKQMAQWPAKVKQAKEAGRQPPRKPRPPVDPKLSQGRPANLYNGMIAPLVPYSLRGAIWYQGEANAGGEAAHRYGLQLTAMIKNWRRVWGQGDFPFEWVQLPNFREPQQQPVETSGWVIVQEQMFKSLALENTGMAITIDVGEAEDIHPKNKQDVGKRLALWALGTTYGKQIVYSGPLYRCHRKGEGEIVVEFDHVGGGLVAKGEKLKGFAIAGADKEFVSADAKIVGQTVVVSSTEVAHPVAVRYAWASNPDCNLYNDADLPASPFRTDDWEN